MLQANLTAGIASKPAPTVFYQALYEHGINAAFAIASGQMNLQDACTRAAPLLTDRARDIARLLILARS